MSQLPRYESYKDSGVQWLGDIPSHWEVWKITHAMDLIGSGTTPKSDNLEYYDGDVLWVTTSELRESYIYDTKQKVTDSAIQDYSALKKYPINSIAIAMYGATIGRLGILAKEATFNQACCVFSGSKVLNHKFLYYWLWMRRPILISLSNGGGQPNLSQDDLKKLKLALPPMDEQKIIADFLDKRLAQVDALIAKQETLLEKLAEQRVALISHAVTKGLNPDVEMKETGISWFKQIPKSWDIKQLKFVITKIQTGSTPPSAVPEYYSSDDIVWYGPADFTDENYILNESVKKISALALEDKVVKPMPKGSIMMIGIGATLGKVAITNVDCTTNQQINSLISIEDVNAKYLMYQLNSLRDIVKLLSSASTLGIINQEKTKCLKIIVPSLNDQNEIVEFLDKELNEISAVKKSVEQTINKLKEYRSTLITQVVTGKIDVRNLKVN